MESDTRSGFPDKSVGRKDIGRIRNNVGPSDLVSFESESKEGFLTDFLNSS